MSSETIRTIEKLRRTVSVELSRRYKAGDKLAGLCWVTFVEGAVGHDTFPKVVAKYGTDPDVLVEGMLRDANRIVEEVLGDQGRAT